MSIKKVAQNKVPAKVTKTATKKTAVKAVQKPVKKPTKVVAKSSVKMPAKKVVKKTPLKNSKAKKMALRYADENTSFWLTDGQILNSLVALKDALSAMSTEVYAYHVGNDRNDFSDWVRVVLEDDRCADDLLKAKDIESAKTIVVTHIKRYSL